MKKSYSQSFYDGMQKTSLSSARVVAPIVYRLVKPASVIDVGCGRGNWLQAFQEAGVQGILGIDGEWVDRQYLVIPEDKFIERDLDKPFNLEHSADLVICLEVAEHLPESSATNLVKELATLAPVVLFSAALPLQGGPGHVNEQWPKYWDDKFRVSGYVPIDAIRRHVWDNEHVSYFYSQNMFLYVRKSDLSKYPLLQQEIESGHGKALALVHPQTYLYFAERWTILVPYLGLIPVPLLNLTKRILTRMRRAWRGK